MTLRIRHWLAEHYIQVDQLGQLSAPLDGIAFRILQDMEIKSLTAFDINVLVEVLELPLRSASAQIEPLCQLSIWLLRLLSRKKPLKRNEGTWIAFQVAYLNALKAILEQEFQLRRPWINRGSIPPAVDADFALLDPPLLALLKTLRPTRLSDTQAEQALSIMSDSFLVQQMHRTAIAWFIANGTEETEAKLICQRLLYALPGYLLKIITDNALALAQLQKFVRLGNIGNWRETSANLNLKQKSNIAADWERFRTGNLSSLEGLKSSPVYPLNIHQEHYRASLMQALSLPMMGESFALKDLYIPLKGQEQGWEVGISAATASTPSSPVDLTDWAIDQLNDLQNIVLIEANPGYGKTSFCQMFAAHVAYELYPQWMPILIRLRDVTLGKTLEQTLDSAFPWGHFIDKDSWLNSVHPPCLIILDGLDELPKSPQATRHLETFLEQLVLFSNQGTIRHKIIITSRPNSGSYPFYLTVHLRRIVIQPMAQDEFRQWFLQWSKLQSKSIAQGLFSFFKQVGLFRTLPSYSEMGALIRQPLMLYLLGILHRDNLLDESLVSLTAPQLKLEIYERLCRWLLDYPNYGNDTMTYLVREGLAHACRSPEAIANLLNGRTPEYLRHQMQVAALTILQTGRYQAPADLIFARDKNIPSVNSELIDNSLTDFEHIFPELLFSDSRSDPYGNRDRPLTNFTIGLGGNTQNNLPSELTSNFLITNQNNQQKLSARALANTNWKRNIEFSHLKLGEYLCAEEIASQLKLITQKVQNNYDEVSFVIDSPLDLARHIYKLIGYGVLSTEIEELIIERLEREQLHNPEQFSIRVLFERLNSFYLSYCRGRWLDEGIAHEIHSQLKAKFNPLNVLEIDASVGLNIFLLLSELPKHISVSEQTPQLRANPLNIEQIPKPILVEAMLSKTQNPPINPALILGLESSPKVTLPSDIIPIIFSPCGLPTEPNNFDADRLLSLIARINVLSPNAFWQRARNSFSQINLARSCLNNAMLAQANFWQSNLSGAELIEVNLRNANLLEVNLSWANLTRANLQAANLSGANLKGADLSGANLLGVNLLRATLTNACVFEAQMDAETKNIASLSGAIFSKEEYDLYKKSLARTKYSGPLPEDSLGELHSYYPLIESAEGEPILPDYLSKDESNEDTLTIPQPLRSSNDWQAQIDDYEDDKDDETSLL